MRMMPVRWHDRLQPSTFSPKPKELVSMKGSTGTFQQYQMSADPLSSVW
ncbi:unnamed protein product [Protopolystoma xenopodis]|uniref:Uncharacterized protein n=1 Tax=Protopolystoma xenopodis TaxID=117903 RepID=A0A3S5B6T8_9PLAT|nr:unnamed protein product [Protopolystoma xenopodis]